MRFLRPNILLKASNGVVSDVRDFKLSILKYVCSFGNSTSDIVHKTNSCWASS